MKPRNYSKYIASLIVVLICVGCSGIRSQIKKDWSQRSPQVLEQSMTAKQPPLNANATQLVTHEGVLLKEVILKKPWSSYSPGERMTAWYDGSQQRYWVKYQRGEGGSLKMQWFGPFELE